MIALAVFFLVCANLVLALQVAKMRKQLRRMEHQQKADMKSIEGFMVGRGIE